MHHHSTEEATPNGLRRASLPGNRQSSQESGQSDQGSKTKSLTRSASSNSILNTAIENGGENIVRSDSYSDSVPLSTDGSNRPKTGSTGKLSSQVGMLLIFLELEKQMLAITVRTSS